MVVLLPHWPMRVGMVGVVLGLMQQVHIVVMLYYHNGVVGGDLNSPHIHSNCTQREYDACVSIGDALIKETQLVFPDNTADINWVCQTWNRFVDCLKDYTGHCFDDQQRKRFNVAVEHPIQSVYQMCMQPAYRQEYLKHASCIKSTITSSDFCNAHYQQLVQHVNGGTIPSKRTVCCSYNRLRHCIEDSTTRLCDGGNAKGEAVTFARQVLSKAFSFLMEQCTGHVGANQCQQEGGVTTNTHNGNDDVFSTVAATTMGFAVPETKSAVQPFSTTGSTSRGTADYIMKPLNNAGDGTTTTITTTYATLPWTPRRQYGFTLAKSASDRPASYGRSNNWRQQDYSNTYNEPAYGTWAPPPQPPTLHDGDHRTTSERWYPAAIGNQLGNDVDEPNQQGLRVNNKKNNNYNNDASWTRQKNHHIIMSSLAIIVLIFI